MTLDNRLKGAVLALLAFGLLGFYVWICVQGIMILDACVSEAPSLSLSAGECKQESSRVTHVMDLFVPISGVVTTVAVTALAVRPRKGASIVQLFQENRKTDASHLPGILISIYVIVWVIIGLAICFNTAYISLEQARKWNIEWLHTLGRTWWPSALTAVGVWLGVPRQ